MKNPLSVCRLVLLVADVPVPSLDPVTPHVEYEFFDDDLTKKSASATTTTA
jgi:hypothetical protein